VKPGEQEALVAFLASLQERARKAGREYETTHDDFRRAFCDGQAHAWGRAASDLADLLGLERS
jgi:hypothetical protein